MWQLYFVVRLFVPPLSICLQSCIPQYMIGHDRLVNDMQTYVADNSLPLSLLGASYAGVSVNDCIYRAKQEARQIAASMTQ